MLKGIHLRITSLREASAFGDDAKSFGRLGEELPSSSVFRRVVVPLRVSKARELGDGDHRSGASFDGSDVGIVDDHPTAVLGEERRGGFDVLLKHRLILDAIA